MRKLTSKPPKHRIWSKGHVCTGVGAGDDDFRAEVNVGFLENVKNTYIHTHHRTVPGMVVHTCSFNSQESEAGES